MSKMKNLLERCLDAGKWSDKLTEDEENEVWNEVPYKERSELRHALNRELNEMKVSREMRAFEFVMVSQKDKVRAESKAVLSEA